MQALELKIPPPLVMVLIGAAMWGIASISGPVLGVNVVRAFTALAVVLAGVAISLAGVISFRRAKTTVNPLKPENTSSLVSSGIYRVTRNPMYVGMLFALIGWAAFLASAWTLIGPLAFLLYITRFQILPEEKMLAALFGADFAAYKTRVRRWL
jgi:protein-S-isoprenylcysteine O-methyltransferase Ste14